MRQSAGVIEPQPGSAHNFHNQSGGHREDLGGESMHAAKTRNLLVDLLFTEENQQLTRALLDSYLKLRPPNAERALVLVSLLTNKDAAVRVEAAQQLGAMNGLHEQILPVLFVACHKEPNEKVRKVMATALAEIDVHIKGGGIGLTQLGYFAEQLRFTPYAKKADTAFASPIGEGNPGQLQRLLVLLNLDADYSVRSSAAYKIAQALPQMSAAQREMVLLNAAYGLRDVATKDSFVRSDVLYGIERLESDAAFLRPLVHSHFLHEDALVRAQAGLAALAIDPRDDEAVQLLLETIRVKVPKQPISLEMPPTEMPVLGIDLEPLYRGITEILGSKEGEEIDFSALEELDRQLVAKQLEIIHLCEERKKMLEQSMQATEDHLNLLTRELIVVKVANRLNQMAKETRLQLLNGMMNLCLDEHEPLRVRVSLVHSLAFVRMDAEKVLEVLLQVVQKSADPKLRQLGCWSIGQLDGLNKEQSEYAEAGLARLLTKESDAIVSGEASLAMKNLRILRARPEERFRFLFDAEGNLKPNAKERLRALFGSPDDAVS